ncbi:MAG: nuclease (SNase protein) [Deltaproteobacteria bacterium]|nr:nuclease (SNase protein) [Deltaproteobacteria bacterium]
MLRRTIASALFILFLFPVVNAFAKDYVVRKIIDGETIQLESGEIIKYIGVSTPDMNKKEGPEFYARQAVNYNKKLVFMKKIRLEFDAKRKDEAGNMLAYVFVKKTFVNAELIRNGYARAEVAPPNLKYKDTLLDAERKAKADDKGIWAEKKKDTEKYYVGNKRTSGFHRPSCTAAGKIPEKGKIIFHNRSDAIKIGYVPCKICKP